MADTLRTAARVRLDVIPSADKALWYLDMFDFVALHLASSGRRHSSTLMELLGFIKRLWEIHTKVQGVVSSPHLSMTLLYGVPWWWSLYLNRCASTFVSEALEDQKGQNPFFIDPILVEIEEWRFACSILHVSLADLLAGRRPSKEGGSGSGGGTELKGKRLAPLLKMHGCATTRTWKLFTFGTGRTHRPY